MDQHPHPGAAPVGEDVSVMRPRFAEDSHHLCKERVHAGAQATKAIGRRPGPPPMDHVRPASSSVSSNMTLKLLLARNTINNESSAAVGESDADRSKFFYDRLLTKRRVAAVFAKRFVTQSVAP